MFTVTRLDLAIAEAERFIRAARVSVVATTRACKEGYILFGVETAAARRASLDLTRALATLRKVTGG